MLADCDLSDASGMFDRLDAYWITATDESGSRRAGDWFDTEDMAVQRLRGHGRTAERYARYMRLMAAS